MKFETTNSAIRFGRISYGKLAIFVLLIIALCPANAMGTEIGLKSGFTGGPMLSIVGIAEVKDKLSFNLPIGGFPGVIMRVESNLRSEMDSSWKNWSPYMQGGIGYTEFFRGKGDGENINDIHFTFGMSRPFRSSWEFSVDIGLLYAPYFVNPWLKEEFPGGIPIVPIIGMEITHKI